LKRRVAVLLSGRGSNLAALARAARDPAYPAEIVLAVSNVPGAPGLALARGEGIRAVAIDHRPFGQDRAAHEAAIFEALAAAEAELVCLAGYMRRLTPWLVGRFAGRMLNIHPSLLPAFPGLDTHARALAAGVKLHGCTVHLVTDALDDGPILAQAAVPVIRGDTPDTLAARVLAQEHLIYPRALALLASGATGAAPGGTAALRNPLIEGDPTP